MKDKIRGRTWKKLDKQVAIKFRSDDLDEMAKEAELEGIDIARYIRFASLKKLWEDKRREKMRNALAKESSKTSIDLEIEQRAESEALRNILFSMPVETLEEFMEQMRRLIYEKKRKSPERSSERKEVKTRAD
jgi:hypothetical protein